MFCARPRFETEAQGNSEIVFRLCIYLRAGRRNLETVLFLRLGPPPTLIPHENEAFRKRSSNRRKLKTPALRFLVDGKHFENEAFRKR